MRAYPTEIAPALPSVLSDVPARGGTINGRDAVGSPADMTVRPCDADVPPGSGLKTVTLRDWTESRSAAGIEASNRVVLTNVVVRSEPFTRTLEPDTKLVPITVKRNPGVPARTA